MTEETQLDDVAKQRRNPVYLEQVLSQLEAIDDKLKFNKLEYYTPYLKQQSFHDLSLMMRERLLMAGNRNGKTYCGAAEFAYHLTGLYPDWWLGRRWERPIKAWAAGETGLATRDIVQANLFGEPGIIAARGTGMIPRHCVDWEKNPPSTARGVADLYDTIAVKHHTNGVFDGWSILKLKSFEQGRAKWQGESLDLLWCDEEPDEEIYGEGLARLGDRDGMVFVTFTPLKGKSKVVSRYMDEHSPDRAYVTMTIDDALHIPAERRQKIIDGYLAHEREARANGTPMLGSGKVFLTPESSLQMDMPEELPAHWWYLWGIDFGIGHPFGASLIGWDKDADRIHVLHAFRMKDMGPINHAAAIKSTFGGGGSLIPVAWPQDGTAREKSGEVVSTLYKKQGLKMLDQHATHPEGGIGTEAGILDMDERMKTGRFKVARHLTEWFEEYRDYHRKDGMIVKLKDDTLSATRIACMMKRFAKQITFFDPSGRFLKKVQRVAADVDFNVIG